MDAYLAPDEVIALLEERICDLNNEIDTYENRQDKLTFEERVVADSSIDRAAWSISMDRSIIEQLKEEALERELGLPSEDWTDPVVIIFWITQDMYDSMMQAKTYDARDLFGEQYEECERVINIIEETAFH